MKALSYRNGAAISDAGNGLTAYPKVLGNSYLLLGGNAVSAGIGLANSAFLARSLGVENYGKFVLTLTLAAAFNMFFEVRVPEAVVRYVSRYQTQGEGRKSAAIIKLCLFIAMATSGITFAVLALGAGAFSEKVLHIGNGAGLLRICAGITVFEALSDVLAATARSFDKFRLLAFYRMLLPILKMAAILILWSSAKMGPQMAGTGILAASALSFLVLSIGVGRMLRAQGISGGRGLMEIRGEMREILKFLWSTNINGYLKIIQTKLDVLLVGYLAGPAEAGILGLAKSLSANTGLLFNPIGESLYPEFSRLSQQGKVAEMKEMVVKVSKLVGAGFLVILSGYLIIGKSSLHLIYSDNFVGTYIPILFFLLGYLLCFLTIWGHPMLLAHGKPEISNRIFFVSLAAQMGACFALVPRYGATGAALAFVVFYVAYDLMIVKYSIWKKLV